jgi:hypothetical protein
VPAELQLNDEERALGYQSLRLISNWAEWTKRRVESITYETATSIRRSVSVDLRLKPSFFDVPVVKWGVHEIHYVPLAQLRKVRLVQFDLRDEDERALPLITKRKNATISAAMLTAATQSVVAARLSDRDSPISVIDPSSVQIPQWLENEFFQLAFLEPDGSERTRNSFAILREYQAAAERTETAPLEGWEWLVSRATVATTTNGREEWRAVLGADPGFVDLAFDIARLYLVYAPIKYEPDRRRIVKYSYSEYLGEGETIIGRRAKVWAGGGRAGRIWNVTEDWLEGLPPSGNAREEWYPALSASAPRTYPVRRRLFEAIGWTTRVGRFETPGVVHGASYHLDVSTPAGIQIRRAQLVTTNSSGQLVRHRAVRGTRTLRAVDLYASGNTYRGGNAYLNMRPESSLIIRAAAMCATFVAVVLTLLWALAPEIIAEEGAHRDAIAAALVVIPGLLTFLSIRDAEHPLTTSMVFGLRVLASAPGLLAFAAAAEVVFANPASPLGLGLFIAAWLAVGILLVAWRLAARGRPDARVLLEER